MSTIGELDEQWRGIVGEALATPAGKALIDFVRAEEEAGKEIYPARDRRLFALHATPFDRVKVVILGQDPYHGPGQAMGLSFSVPKGVRRPPSLNNIFSEIERDTGETMPEHGDLTGWAGQGVLMLNSVLTVERGRAGSHGGQGWEAFTDALIRALAERRQGLVFLLWGNYAQKKAAFVNRARHAVLATSHPSPLGAWRGFNGCGHFSAANRTLEAAGQAPIRWADL